MTGSIQLRLMLAMTIALAAVVIGGSIVLRSGERRDANAFDASESRPSGLENRSSREPPEIARRPSQPLTVVRTDALVPEWNDGTHDVIGPVVEGTIVLTDRENVKRAEEDGAFVPDFVDGVDSDAEAAGGATPDPSDPSRRPVAVKRGHFRFDARGATAMLVAELELGGHAAVVDGGVDFSTDGPLELTARWIDDVLLHVVDATTREELSGVRVCFGGRFVPRAEHPGLAGPPSLLFDVERSPVHLTRATSIDRVVMDGAIWVGARDHAWRRESIDFERERQHEVALGPAGALAIRVIEPSDAPPFDRLAPPRVRLRHPGMAAGEPICDFAAEPGQFDLDGLEPGDVVAAIEIGDSQLLPLALSRAEISIRADETAHATLSLDLSMKPKSTMLAGTAYVPPAWGRTGMLIDLEAIRVPGGTRDDQHLRTSISVQPLAGRPCWHEWSVRRILPGTYRLLVHCAGLETNVEVGEEGRDDIALTLEEPAVLHVRVVDDESLREFEIEESSRIRLSWIPNDLGFAAMQSLELDRATSRWIGAVHPGDGRIFFSNGGRGSTFGRYTVAAGANDIVLRSPAACGVLLRIVGRTEKRKSFEITWSITRSADRDETGFDWIGMNDASRRIVLPRPGRYRFSSTNEEIGGGELPFEVDVPKGKFVQKTITVDR